MRGLGGVAKDVTSPVLRPYQLAGVEAARAHIRAGRRRVILCCPTGGGKTVNACYIIQSAREHFQAKVLFVAHRVELIDQAVRQLARWGVTEVGVIRANDERTNALMPVQVATVQSLSRRQPPPADIVFIDECHRAAAQSYKKVLEIYPEAIVLGLTATPSRADGKPLGDVFDAIEIVATYSELIKDGFIVAPRCFAAKAKVHLENVKTVAGDYVLDQLESAMMEVDVLGDVLKEYQLRAEGRRTVIFACTVKHSKAIQAQLVEAGIRCAHVDAETPEGERADVSRKLRAGELDVVSNVGIYCLDDKTEILTSDGWVGIDEMTTKHLVANWDNGNVTFEAPSEVVRRQRRKEERMIVLDSPRLSVRVTESHRMLYRTLRDGQFLKCQAQELVERQVCLPVSGLAKPARVSVVTPEPVASIEKAISHTAHNLRKRNGYDWNASLVEATRRVNRFRSLQYKQPADLSTDECALIGFWIGDGSVTKRSGVGVEYKLFQPESKPKIVEWLDHILMMCGIDSLRSGPRPARSIYGVDWKRGYQWSLARGTGSGTQERRGVFSIEPYLKKDGTYLFWGMSECQFDALLYGFWMANGDHLDGSDPNPKRARKFYSVNSRLLDLLQAVATVRGYRAKVARRSGTNILTLTLHKTDDFCLGKKYLLYAEEGWKSERVWCVKTRTKNIITRRRGTVVVTGNTEGWDEPCVKHVILARPTKSLTLFMQMCGRGLRPWENVTPILSDLGENIDRHGFPHEDRVWSLDERVEKPARKPSKCIKCRAYLRAYPCPECGYAPEVSPREVRIDYSATTEEKTFQDPRRAYFDMQVETARSRGYKPGFAAAKFKEKFGTWPPWSFSNEAKAAFSRDDGWQRRNTNHEANKARWAKHNAETAEPAYDSDDDFLNFVRGE
jgi:superfamily II DNA or RNA helicase